MTAESRITALASLENDHFDVVVVGGGVSGAWISLHCSSLGFKTAIVERGDFAGETSSASSKLLHGGIRYLQQLQFGKVRESTMERAAYLFAAPHLSSPIPFIVPTYRDLKRSKFLLRCGITAYQLLGLGQNTIAPIKHQYDTRIMHLSAAELDAICDISHLDHTGAIAFPEFHMHDSERTVWAIIDSARALGATAVNYLTATEILVNENTSYGIQIRDNESGKQFPVKGKLVINAAGPWVDSLNLAPRKASGGDEVKPLIHNYAAGAHVITRQITSEHAIAISTKQKSVAAIDRGGRHIFIIPWRGYSLIGTSYRETDDPDSTGNVSTEDLYQLLEAVNDTLPATQLTANDIVSAYVGLYPLRTETQLKATYQGTGEYKILDHSVEDGIDGLITSLGAKFTTGRILAEKTTRLAEAKLNANRMPSSTSLKIRLASAAYDDLKTFTRQQIDVLANRLTTAQIKHLITLYGSHISEFIEYIDDQPDAIELVKPVLNGQPDILGQVAWAIDRELAIHLDDVLLRRTSLGLLGITPVAMSKVAELMAKRLGWKADQYKVEIEQAVSRGNNIRKTAEAFYRED